MPRPPRRARACTRAAATAARRSSRRWMKGVRRPRTAPADFIDLEHHRAPDESGRRSGTRTARRAARRSRTRRVTYAGGSAHRATARARAAWRDLDTADGGSRRVVARIEPTRRRQAACWPRGQDGSGPGARPCSAARASRPRRAKGVEAQRGACGHVAVWRIFTRFYRAAQRSRCSRLKNVKVL